MLSDVFGCDWRCAYAYLSRLTFIIGRQYLSWDVSVVTVDSFSCKALECVQNLQVINPVVGVKDEHFAVWMRTAGLSKFRKLYGRWVESPPDACYYRHLSNAHVIPDLFYWYGLYITLDLHIGLTTVLKRVIYSILLSTTTSSWTTSRVLSPSLSPRLVLLEVATNTGGSLSSLSGS